MNGKDQADNFKAPVKRWIPLNRMVTFETGPQWLYWRMFFPAVLNLVAWFQPLFRKSSSLIQSRRVCYSRPCSTINFFRKKDIAPYWRRSAIEFQSRPQRTNSFKYYWIFDEHFEIPWLCFFCLIGPNKFNKEWSPNRVCDLTLEIISM